MFLRYKISCFQWSSFATTSLVIIDITLTQDLRQAVMSLWYKISVAISDITLIQDIWLSVTSLWYKISGDQWRHFDKDLWRSVTAQNFLRSVTSLWHEISGYQWRNCGDQWKMFHAISQQKSDGHVDQLLCFPLLPLVSTVKFSGVAH